MPAWRDVSLTAMTAPCAMNELGLHAGRSGGVAVEPGELPERALLRLVGDGMLLRLGLLAARLGGGGGGDNDTLLWLVGGGVLLRLE